MNTHYMNDRNIYANNMYPTAYYDPEAQMTAAAIDDKHYLTIRHGFLRKVYGILAAQFLLTAIFGGICTYNEVLRHWMLTHTLIPVICGFLAIVPMLVLSCHATLAQSYPTNYILLALFTAMMSVSVGSSCAITAGWNGNGSDLVLKAAIITAVLTIGLVIFACQTKYSFIKWQGILFIALLCLMAVGIVIALMGTGSMWLWLGMSVLFCGYIVIDTQIILGRDGCGPSEDAYILCAMTLYIDIVNLFLAILNMERRS